MWCRADSTNGYLCEFDIYTGKSPHGVQNGLGYTVVTQLCQHIKENYMPFSVTIFLLGMSWWGIFTGTKYSAVALYVQVTWSFHHVSLTKISYQNDEKRGCNMEDERSSFSIDLDGPKSSACNRHIHPSPCRKPS